MVRHILVMDLKSEFTEEEKKQNAVVLKEKLEGMVDQIEELIDCKVYCNLLPDSTTDLMMSSLFRSEEELASYQVHPEHVKVSDFLFTIVQNIKCVDYIE